MDTNSAEKVEKVLRKIRELRKTKGLSHENIAIELDMSPSAYNKLERGETTLSLERLLKISEIFEINVGDILDIAPTNQFNQTNKENSTAYLQQTAHFYQENREFMTNLLVQKMSKLHC